MFTVPKGYKEVESFAINGGDASTASSISYTKYNNTTYSVICGNGGKGGACVFSIANTAGVKEIEVTVGARNGGKSSISGCPVTVKRNYAQASGSTGHKIINGVVTYGTLGQSGHRAFDDPSEDVYAGGGGHGNTSYRWNQFYETGSGYGWDSSGSYGGIHLIANYAVPNGGNTYGGGGTPYAGLDMRSECPDWAYKYEDSATGCWADPGHQGAVVLRWGYR